MIHRLSDNNTLANQFLRELRHIDIQADRMRFRKNLKRIGQIFAYEISKTFDYKEVVTPTVLGEARGRTPKDKVVLATILRAGLPLHNGLLSYFDEADNAYVSAYRKHEADGSFQINMQYLTCPSIDNKILIISDPMLATGESLKVVIDGLLEYGKPLAIHVVVVIAASKGLHFISEQFPNIHFWIGEEDPVLNAKSYIIPGLGDAGDLAFGEKLQG